MKKVLLLLLALVCLTLAVSAKETVIYENDFSNSDLSAFKMHGTMQVTDGALKAIGTGASAYVSYDLPEKYQGMDYIVEVDYLDVNNMGGLLVGATSDKLTQMPSYFSGYTCTVGSNGDKTYIAYFSQTGWGGNFAPSTNVLTTNDIHLWARVYKGALTFRVYTLDQKTLIQEFRYEPGDHENDIYDTLTSTVGLRQYYADAGRFDNFKVTVLEDDALPSMNTSLSVGNTAFKASGLAVKDGVVSGNGAMLSDKALTGEYRVNMALASKGTSRLYFGMTDTKNGYVFEINGTEQKALLLKMENGVTRVLSHKSVLVREGYCDLVLDVHDGIASLYYDYLFQGNAAFPIAEFYLDGTDGKFGLWLEGGSVQGLMVGDSTVTLPEETYLNAVNFGADPDVLYYEGTYYLYVYAGNDGSNIFRVYTSPDLVHFTQRNYIFNWDPYVYSNANGKTAWSPNVFYNESDGLFYLFFAAEQLGEDTSRRVYYASSDSPFGPFKHDGPLVAINDVTEIDGHPFIGYDGKTYMSFSRYDLGGTIWFEEVTIQDGVVTAKPETATRVVISDMPWDNDGALRLVEGGFVWKHDGYYYLIYATGSYSRHYGEAVAVSKNPLGPYEKMDVNPILNWNYLVDGPGDALMIPSPDGEELYMIYHRHCEPDNGGSRRETCIDLVQFVKDPDGGPDRLVVRSTSTTPQKMPSNKYRFDINRDGAVTLADVLLVLRAVRSDTDYSGYYDVDANGSIGMTDVLALLAKVK